MTSHHHVPSEDSVTSIEQLIGCAHDVECTCADRGISLHPAEHPLSHEHVEVAITESTAHLIDGYPEYGD